MKVRGTPAFRRSKGVSQVTLGLVAWGWLSEEVTFHLEPEREEGDGLPRSCTEQWVARLCVWRG